MDLKDLCPHCGWRVEPFSKHSRSCRYHNHPDYNPDRNVAYRASPAALKHTPALIALDMDLKVVDPIREVEVEIPNPIREVEVNITNLREAGATTGTEKVTTTSIRGNITTTLHQGTLIEDL